MLLSRAKITSDGRLVTKDEEELENESQDSISEGAKIVVNTESHVNESAIAVTINESDCLVRFENGDEETVPIEAVSAFESMANDGGPGSGVKGHQTQNSENSKTKTSPQKALQIAAAKQQVKELHEKAKKGQEIDFKRLDQLENFLEANKANEDSETNSQIEELTKNMDAARARGYDTSAYQKEIARLKSKDAANSQEVMAALKEQYGEEKGEQVFYAMKNSGKIGGIGDGAEVKDEIVEIYKGYRIEQSADGHCTFRSVKLSINGTWENGGESISEARKKIDEKIKSSR